MHDYAGGRIVPGIVDNYPVPQIERVVYTTESDMHRILGMDVTLPEISAGLHRLNFVTEQVAALPAPLQNWGVPLSGYTLNLVNSSYAVSLPGIDWIFKCLLI